LFFSSHIYVDKFYLKKVFVYLKTNLKHPTKLFLNLNKNNQNQNIHSLLFIYMIKRLTFLIVNFSYQEYQLILIDILKVCLILLFDLVCCWSSCFSLFTLFRVKTNIGIIACVKVPFQLPIQQTIIYLLKQI